MNDEVTQIDEDGKEIQVSSISAIMAYEDGSLSERNVLYLFSHLIKTGLAWRLQGSYGRAAHSIIEGGIIDKQGDIHWDIYEELLSEL